MIIPVWVDEKKDKKLIEWLGEKTNRSAFIRFVLYEKMHENEAKYEKIPRNIEENSKESEEINKNLIGCIDGW
jgi:hypothetical protein